MIEEWVTDDVAAECTLADHAEHNELLWDTNVKPYLDMTVKGWVWYQVWSALYPNPHFSSSLPLVPIDALFCNTEVPLLHPGCLPKSHPFRFTVMSGRE